MRLSATLLATILAVLVISGTGPGLSGMTTLPPCEVASQVQTTPKPTAPANLRIIKDLEDQFEDLLVSGPNAGPDADYYEPATATAGAADPHAYYLALASRRDCFAAYSLRAAAQVDGLRAPKSVPPNMAYVYQNDPDPRRQDATKIIIPEGQMGPGLELRMKAGPSRDANVLITFDQWWGSEFNQAHSKLDLHKESPIALDSGGGLFLPMRTSYSAARQAEHNQPPGGPYVAMAYIQGKAASPKTPKWWSDGMTGYPRVRMPADAPYKEQRGYSEGLAPIENEIGIVGDRWHRFWHYLERAPDQDWVTATGVARKAFRYSMWFADTQRGPIRVMNEAIVSIPATDTGGITQMAAHMGAGNSNVDSKYAGRGDLVAYTRNWVALHGTSKAEALALLAKPVN